MYRDIVESEFSEVKTYIVFIRRTRYPFRAILFIDIPPLTINSVTHTIQNHIVRSVTRSLSNYSTDKSYSTSKEKFKYGFKNRTPVVLSECTVNLMSL